MNVQAPNSITIRQLQIFVQLAESRSFAEAALRLHLSQPALSIAIRKFEESVGGCLLSRSTRMLELTPEGRAFLPVAQRLLHDWDEAFTDLHNLFAMQRGKLTIAAMPSFANSLLPQILKLFHQQHANINISLLDVVMERVMEAVLDGRAELGIIFEAQHMPGLEFMPLCEDSFVVLLNPEHRLSQLKSLSWTDLHGQSYVAMNRGSTIRAWCEEAVKQTDAHINIVAEASQLSTVGQLVAAGLGVSVVPAICRDDMLRRGLCCVPLAHSGPAKRIGVIRRSRSNLSVPATHFLALIFERFVFA
ncbi:LysR family transcriptional regulator [Bowmanella yangjiangensis]|uniref:LysR family transcriptional regulator n=1 Tax=Bowmanella yangjiangensis TaxID=2811230 RepID=A0ABS3CUM8_9ALTE|nr:LysR family transcriptional regulator [Bowmanella yangjiangensis]MBN7820015.1 LysR family transcriptional regulator [Bowmanella yangjiangensis]